ncbi:hypothetical protein [Solitalea canadensis]|uniref:hypothetical protein n=1 Tax=Solitalea canadensis TaxID=995 RepID=UPI0002E0DC09|nr:hypothetical protein [Solitalea canadensis]
MRQIKPQTEFDELMVHYLSGTVDRLSETKREILERWEQANDLIRHSYKSDKDVIDHLVTQYRISKSTARLDLMNTKRFFGLQNRDTKEYYRGVYLEWLHKAVAMAFTNNDPETVGKVLKVAALIQGMDKDDSDIPNYEDLQQHVIEIGYIPDSLNVPKIENLEKVVASFLKEKAKKKAIDELAEDVDVIGEGDTDGETGII